MWEKGHEIGRGHCKREYTTGGEEAFLFINIFIF
jgi:hypothetical protein